MKPFQILLFLLCIGLALVGITFFSTEDAIKKDNKAEDGWQFGSISLKYPTFSHFLSDSVIEAADIDSIVSNVAVVLDESDMEDTLEIAQIPGETYQKPAPLKMNFENIDTSMLQRIEFPDQEFIKKLSSKLQSKKCKIIHYGDSQLEGDRISGYLRSKLQTQFGGSGPGFLPILPVYHQLAAEITPSDNWIRNAIFDGTQRRRKPAKYGAYLSLSRFTPVIPDSMMNDSIPISEAKVSVGISNRSYRHSRYFNQILLHYDNASEPCYLEVRKGELVLYADTLNQDGKYHAIKINLPSWEQKEAITFHFRAQRSPDFYGFTLENEYGIGLDNVAMRGSAGTKFVSLDFSSTHEMMRQLDPQLLLMQFGGNVMPHLKDSSSIDRYMRQLKAQFRVLRKWNPNAQIIFIGPSDMSYAVDGQMQSYPLLPAMNNSIRALCKSQGIAFWSMYDAMGGQNSMLTWVEKKYAANDYTHFAPKGTKIISELFYLALMLEIEKIK